MTDKQFNKLHRTELLKGLVLCSDNAQRHYKAALEVVKIDLYGIGNAHLILSAEESIKALLFVGKLLHPEQEFEVEAIFKDHVKKHLTAREVYDSFKHLIEVLRETLETIVQNIHMFVYQDKEKVVQASVQLVGDNLQEKIARNTGEESKRERKWWNKANKKKNNGFYVDYEANNWLTPGDITQSEYLESKDIVEKILFPVALTIQVLNEELELFIKLYRDELAKKNTQAKRQKTNAKSLRIERK